jgi:hypothetical protein
MIAIELQPNQLFKAFGEDRFIFSFWGVNENGTVRARKVAQRSDRGAFFMIPDVEMINFSQYLEVELCY